MALPGWHRFAIFKWSLGRDTPLEIPRRLPILAGVGSSRLSSASGAEGSDGQARHVLVKRLPGYEGRFTPFDGFQLTSRKQAVESAVAHTDVVASAFRCKKGRVRNLPEPVVGKRQDALLSASWNAAECPCASERHPDLFKNRRR